MAVDNPSYFSLSDERSSSAKTTIPTSTTSSRGHGSGLSALFRRRTNRMGAAASQTGVVSEPTSNVPTHHGEGRGSASGASTPSTPTEERVPMLSQNTDAAHPAGGKRRSFRNLFRSVSANTDHERTEKFLKGDPRPSDVAPPSPYLPHRSHSHSEKDRYRPDRGRRVLKSASELLSNDMVYCGLAGNSKDRYSDVDDDDDDTAEVFLSANDARYYNLSSTLPFTGSTTACRRRHSIGTFLGKEASASGSSAVTPGQQAGGSRNVLKVDMMAAPISVDDIDGTSCNEGRAEQQAACNKTRRKKRKSSNKGSHSALSRDEHTEDDVLFIFSKQNKTSILWINYLTAFFEPISRQQGRPPYKVRHMAIEEPISPTAEERIRSSRLQIIIVCPALLECVQTSPEHIAHLTRHLTVERMLAMMLGVDDSHINDVHKSNLVSYEQWRRFYVKDQDETFVGKLLGTAINILGNTLWPALKSDKTAFSVHPKKVKLGQNRLIVLLNDPLSPDDDVSVIVDRCGDAIDIRNVKRRNPYVLQFSIPERCLEVSMLVGVRISKNGCSLGVRQVKCESRLRELDQILRAHDNPLEFMCQTFGFSSTDREQLDNWLVHAFQKNIPPHFNLLSTPSGMVPTYKNYTSSEESPTLLHFAARFGLEKLAWLLLECPGGDLACDLRNVSELTPADLAEQAGHTKLAQQLRGYMQMNEFTNMYSYLKVMSETTNRSTGMDHDSTTDVPSAITHETNNEKEDYCRPRPLSEAYLVPPVARPITILTSSAQMITDSTITNNPLAVNYSTVPTPTPVILPSISTTVVSSNELDLSLQGYMKMHPAGSKTSITTTTPTTTTRLQSSRTNTPTQGSRQECHQNSSVIREDNCSQKINQNPSFGRTSSNCSTKSREPSGPQDELLEIINDFKNNVFTISEVERLVENWQKRNDVQQSFKDKQRQLTAMREEYDRIQKKMKEDMKTATPFDKIRKFFSKGKKDTKESTNAVADLSSSKPENINSGLADHRPVSSLSLRSVSSSSSSGRMSTVSGCSGTSLVDSGNHSDSEDRRLQNVRDEKTGIMSYEIPPAPKPFTGRHSPALGYFPLPSVSVARNLDVRQTQSPSRAEDTEYYIAFPPSGLPIHAFKADGSPRESDMPNSPCEHSKDLDFVTASSSKQQEEIEATKYIGNSYANIDPLATNFPPVSSPRISISDSMNSESASADFIHIDKKIAIQCDTDNSSACSDNLKVKLPVLAQPTVDEIDSTLISQGQETAVTKYNQEPMPINSTNVSKRTNEASESGMPEYMNLAVNIGHDAAKVLGTIPKKLPAPPVPPRGATSYTE